MGNNCEILSINKGLEEWHHFFEDTEVATVTRDELTFGDEAATNRLNNSTSEDMIRTVLQRFRREAIDERKQKKYM